MKEPHKTQKSYNQLNSASIQDKKIYKSIVAVIRIINPKTDEVEATHIKNIDDKERREWVGQTVMWALMNGKIAEVVNKDDDKE